MISNPFDRFQARRDAGFTLIEIVVVLLIFSVVVGMAAMITRGVSAAQKRSLTGTRIATVDAALIQFAQQQKRLPCPGDGTLASTNANAGLEGGRNAAGCTTNQQNGVVPWRALALSETEATDGWERRLTYRIASTLAADTGMDMSWCDPAGIEPGAVPRVCNAACSSASLATCTPPMAFLNTKGLEVRNVAGTVLMNPAVAPSTGAAYVLISHGESGGGGYLNTGQLATSSTADGLEEVKNYANVAIAVGTYYVDDSLMEVAGTHFDDVVSRPSILNVITKAGLGPRAH
jgi:prepilin-type N-terminal cleavage/methylation domain-containing protein